MPNHGIRKITSYGNYLSLDGVFSQENQLLITVQFPKAGRAWPTDLGESVWRGERDRYKSVGLALPAAGKWTVSVKTLYRSGEWHIHMQFIEV